MFNLLGLFNSVIFMFINLMVGLYVFRRFFVSMRLHSKLVAEIAEFNRTVGRSRSCLDYIGHKVSDAMKEIEGDIDKELQITHRLTKLSSQLVDVNKRFTKLEEEVIEMVRTDYNMESIKIETPADINDEVKKVLSLKQPDKRTSCKPQKKRKFSTTTLNGVTFNNSSAQNSQLQKLPCLPSLTETIANPYGISSDDKSEEDSAKHRTAPIKPVVQLLREQRPVPEAKPIGFRPSWKCNA
ncbi:uncharacterized protein LOC105693269 [Athalia rosae]|uniref:uncharacterized protein LOC105693269 n=1 Tax=Athalia rosae TaxID=37344 RepID=UPI0020345918|nr:uncharacterized protein LOC105693269 [Athalia rosae]